MFETHRDEARELRVVKIGTHVFEIADLTLSRQSELVAKLLAARDALGHHWTDFLEDDETDILHLARDILGDPEAQGLLANLWNWLCGLSAPEGVTTEWIGDNFTVRRMRTIWEGLVDDNGLKEIAEHLVPFGMRMVLVRAQAKAAVAAAREDGALRGQDSSTT